MEPYREDNYNGLKKITFVLRRIYIYIYIFYAACEAIFRPTLGPRITLTRPNSP